MFTLTWITDKELERVIQNKLDEFRWKKNMTISYRPCPEKMRKASGQQGEASKVKISGSEKNKSEHEHGNNSSIKIICN